MKLIDDHYCFACGKENPISLKLVFSESLDCVSALFTPVREYQGYKNFMHGGIASTLLDEAMARLLIDVKKIPVLTVKMEIKFRKPVLIGELVTINAKYAGQMGKFHKVTAELRLRDDSVAVQAHGTFAPVEGTVENE